MTQREAPPRWDDDASSDELLRRLVRAGKHDGPSARSLGAAPAAIAALLSAHGAGAAGIAGAAAVTAKSTLSAAVLGKWFGAGLLAGTLLMTTTRGAELVRGSAGPSRAPITAVEPAPSTPRPTSVAAPTVTVPPQPVSSSSPSPPPSTRTSVAREVALLDKARSALVGGDPGEALRVLDVLQRLPGRVLAPEATVLRVRSHLARGEISAAQRLAAAFHRSAPESPQAAVLRSLLTAARTAASTDPAPAPAGVIQDPGSEL